MTMPVQVVESDGQFTVTLIGAPSVSTVGKTRVEALNKMRSELNRRRAIGEIVDLDFEPVGISSLAGTFKDDPTLQEICDEIYRERDRERDSLNFE